jgi:hypothetical protein
MSGIIGGAGSKSGVIGETELDYEEGTWTATVTGGSESSVSNTTGQYTKIGNLVYFSYYNGSWTMASASSHAQIHGLPFNASNANWLYSVFQYVYGNAVDGNSTGGYITNNTDYMRFVDAGSDSLSTYIDGTTKALMVSGCYLVA